LKQSSNNSHNSLFSHLYIEKGVEEHPDAQRIMKKFSASHIIEINHYKDVFNRANQDFAAQSYSKNLILAKKEAPFLYEGSYYSDGFEYEHFFYTPSLIGCLYDCDYCYLQGLYNSANSVLFVNLEDFFEALLPYLHKPTLVAISYDTDTLAVEKLIGHSQRWIEFAQTQQNLHLEIRTKSANFKSIAHLRPSKNIVLAWSLSPQSIVAKYEHKTPSLVQRLKAIKEALHLGWQVRLCIDPVIYDENFEQNYFELVETIFSELDADTIFQITLGSFRMSSQHLKKLKKLQRSDVAFYPYEVKDGIAAYPKEIEQKILNTLIEKVCEYIPQEKVRTWQLQ